MSMPTETIAIQVSPQVAAFYRQASARERRRAEIALAISRMGREKALEQFEQVMNRMVATARERGLSDAGLDALLSRKDDP